MTVGSLPSGVPVSDRQISVTQVTLYDSSQLHSDGVTNEPKETWSWCVLTTSIISVCCVSFLGFIATVLAILAYVDHNAKQYNQAIAKKNAALKTAIASIVVGTLLFIIILVIKFT